MMVPPSEIVKNPPESGIVWVHEFEPEIPRVLGAGHLLTQFLLAAC